MTTQSRSFLLFLAIGLILVPSFASAKSPNLKGYERAKGQSITVSDPLGWPISLQTSSYNNTSLESLPGMAVVRMKPYKPWWKLFGSIPNETTATISGLPANTDLHVYTRGYRDHEVKKTDASGTLSFTFPSKSGIQYIIKARPSTKHIKMGDCGGIGTWDELTTTCTLSADVHETIAIEDNGITLNGNGKSVFSPQNGSGDGISTDRSDVTIKNIEVHGFARAIVYADTFWTFANGGTIREVTLGGNGQGIVDDGVSSLTILTSNIVNNNPGISLRDQFDGHGTNGIWIARNNFKANAIDIINDGTSFDLSTAGNRGNYWDKNISCTQDPNNHSQCTNSYNAGPATDAQPWACENGWTHACPYTPPETPTPIPSGEETGTPTPSGTGIPSTNAVIENARSILGALYQWGAKGFDYGPSKFTSADKIKNGMYQFYNPYKTNTNGTEGALDIGRGVDCSGLSLWSYDEDQYGNQKVNWWKCTRGKECLIAYEGAQGQHDSNTKRITKDQLQPGDLLFIDTPFQGKGIDHMALYTGESPNNVIHASGYTNSVTYANYEPATNELVTKNASGVIQRLKVDSFGRVAQPKIELIAIMYSPVSMIITDPDGFTSNKDNPWNGPMEYQVHDVDENGELNDIMLTGNRKLGNYKFKIVPKPGALNTDTYTIIISAWINGAWVDVELAKDAKVSDIPKESYTIHSTASGITKVTAVDTSKNAICHKPPGNPGNAHTLYLPASALSAHLAHGDTKGECEFEKKNSGDAKEKDNDNKDKEEKKENKKNDKNKK